MRHLASNPAAINLIPCSCICLRSCLPAASTNVTLLRSTRIDCGDSVDAVARQHLSSSPTQAPPSLPSTKKRVVPESMRLVILSTVGFSPAYRWQLACQTDATTSVGKLPLISRESARRGCQYLAIWRLTVTGKKPRGRLPQDTWSSILLSKLEKSKLAKLRERSVLI